MIKPITGFKSTQPVQNQQDIKPMSEDLKATLRDIHAVNQIASKSKVEALLDTLYGIGLGVILTLICRRK